MKLLLGIGHRFRSDDGLGPYVVRQINRTQIDGFVARELKGDFTNIIDSLKDYQELIVVDASMSDQATGSYQVIDYRKEGLPTERIYLSDRKAQRVGHLRPFYLEGGEAAIKDPQRIADALRSPDKEKQGPLCSSMGRLFDGVSALIAFTGNVSFEGEAAIQLEEWATADTAESYPFAEENGIIDWAPMIDEIIRDKATGVTREIMATKLHNTVIAMMLTMAKKVNCKQIVLNGGCFQNDFLLEHSVKQLRQHGFKVCWPKQLPANDGGLSYGQLWASNVEIHSDSMEGGQGCKSNYGELR